MKSQDQPDWQLMLQQPFASEQAREEMRRRQAAALTNQTMVAMDYRQFRFNNWIARLLNK